MFKIDKGSGSKSEVYIPFSDTGSWHTLSVTNDREVLSATLDEVPLITNVSGSYFFAHIKL